jgi:ubiquitin carboxyl-terminal hydrolase L5
MDDGPLADVSACSGERRRSSRIQASSSIGSNGPEPSIQTTPPTESSETAPVTKSARSSPRAGSHAMDHGPTTAQRTGLRRRNEASDFIAPDPISEAMRPLTDEERRNWAGWVELESDPVGLALVY